MVFFSTSVFVQPSLLVFKQGLSVNMPGFTLFWMEKVLLEHIAYLETVQRVLHLCHFLLHCTTAALDFLLQSIFAMLNSWKFLHCFRETSFQLRSQSMQLHKTEHVWTVWYVQSAHFKCWLPQNVRCSTRMQVSCCLVCCLVIFPSIRIQIVLFQLWILIFYQSSGSYTMSCDSSGSYSKPAGEDMESLQKNGLHCLKWCKGL